MALKSRHISKVLKLPEGLRIYGETHAYAWELSREQRCCKVDNSETVGNTDSFQICAGNAGEGRTRSEDFKDSWRRVYAYTRQVILNDASVIRAMSSHGYRFIEYIDCRINTFAKKGDLLIYRHFIATILWTQQMRFAREWREEMFIVSRYPRLSR